MLARKNKQPSAARSRQPLPLAILAYITALAGAAALIVLATLSGFPTENPWLNLAIFIAMGILAESWAVPTTVESSMSLSFTVNFATGILFGPAFAAIVAVASVVAADTAVSRRPPSRVVFNASQTALCAALGAMVYHALADPGPVSLYDDAPALLASAGVFLLVNNTLVTIVLSLAGRSFLHEWGAAFRDVGVLYVSMGPLGALVALTYQESPLTLLYFIPLVLVIYTGFRLYVNLQQETDRALVALADTVDKRDEYTYQHSARVAEHVAVIARRLHLPQKEIDLVISAARVHDLGKISTDNRILYKQSSLTDEERRMINEHPADGSELAGKFSMYRQGQAYIRHHHERWDGRGYPDGLAGTAIPLGARVIAVADSYDAMTSDRPYRKALPHDIAVAELRRGAGKQFDPAVVEAFAATNGAMQQVRSRPPILEATESCSYS